MSSCAGGSSPRTRGTRHPAQRRDHRPVHPRARGEHCSLESFSTGCTMQRRFIPAHAGNTLPVISLYYKDLEERELSTDSLEEIDPFSGVVKEPLVASGKPRASSACCGRKETSLNPSITDGTLRFSPKVSKSKPLSLLVDHATTTLPSPQLSLMTPVSISRTREE